MTENRAKFNFGFWIFLFFIMLLSIPTLIHFGYVKPAKILGVAFTFLSVFAVRRWMYLLKKPAKVFISLNDKYWLKEHIDFYKELSKSDKIIFEDRVALFLTDIIVTEIGKDMPEKSTCLYVASSAVITFWGLPYWNYGRLSEVLVYPENFNEDNTINEQGVVAGKVHQGGLMDTTMILSLPTLEAGFKNFDDKQNVGIHEFAHLVDKASGTVDGVPVGMSREDRKLWLQLCDQEMKAILKGKSEINAYAATNKGEFFAVIVEVFKENPSYLEKKHPELFEILTTYFNSEKG
jgi:Mlc titration factor MtfA (ptsG expression regulator)